MSMSETQISFYAHVCIIFKITLQRQHGMAKTAWDGKNSMGWQNQRKIKHEIPHVNIMHSFMCLNANIRYGHVCM